MSPFVNIVWENCKHAKKCLACSSLLENGLMCPFMEKTMQEISFHFRNMNNLYRTLGNERSCSLVTKDQTWWVYRNKRAPLKMQYKSERSERWEIPLSHHPLHNPCLQKTEFSWHQTIQTAATLYCGGRCRSTHCPVSCLSLIVSNTVFLAAILNSETHCPIWALESTIDEITDIYLAGHANRIWFNPYVM